MASHGRLRSIPARFAREDQGPTATEYAILLALLILVAVAAIQGIGSRMINIYTNIEGAIPG